MGLTYVQLKQAIQDFTENDATEFTTATGSGKAPIDLCIEFAEMRVFREADVAAYRKTVDVTLSANNQFLDLPQDLYDPFNCNFGFLLENPVRNPVINPAQIM